MLWWWIGSSNRVAKGYQQGGEKPNPCHSYLVIFIDNHQHDDETIILIRVIQQQAVDNHQHGDADEHVDQRGC